MKRSINLRSQPVKLSEKDVKIMIEKYGFFDKIINNKPREFKNNFRTDDGYKTIIDDATGLRWQNCGSEKK